jgi:hypothetical protein
MSRYIRFSVLTRLLVFFLLALSITISPQFTGAQSGTFSIDCPQGETYIALFDSCLGFADAVGLAVSWSLIIGILIAGVKLSIGAIQYMFSTGDPQKLQNARDTLTDAALGLVLLVSAWVLLGYIEASLPASWGIRFFTIDLN